MFFPFETNRCKRPVGDAAANRGWCAGGFTYGNGERRVGQKFQLATNRALEIAMWT